jgi:MFS-type transporter involved in bile tolerance (Atg22 family)
MLFLFSYAIYNDSVFAFGTVIGNLFNLNVRPSMVEFTAYSITGTFTSIVGSLIFLYVFPHTRLSLRHWALIAYSIVIFITLWCCLGMSSKVNIGFKHRAEFYVFQVLQNIAGSIITPLFRVLFPEMFPKGNEIQYFGFQLVVSLRDPKSDLTEAFMRHNLDPAGGEWTYRRQDQQPAAARGGVHGLLHAGVLLGMAV